MRCLYCQNWQLSWKNDGREVSAAKLAEIMLRLQDDGCHNINLVSPSHVVAQILDALVIADERGLSIGPATGPATDRNSTGARHGRKWRAYSNSPAIRARPSARSRSLPVSLPAVT
jgi:hypothetical protein